MTRVAHQEATSTEGNLANAATNRNVGRWKRAHIRKTLATLDAEEARDVVFGAVTAYGTAAGTELVSSFGTIKLRTRTYVDWEAMARAMVMPNVIDGLLATYTKTSDPYIQAPDGWSAEAKAEAVHTSRKRRPVKAAARRARRSR